MEAMREPLAAIAPGANADPRVNGSIFRINRDTRFSRDKTPYKTHVDLWFWMGPERKTSPGGYFVRGSRPIPCGLAAECMWCPSSQLARLRRGLRRTRPDGSSRASSPDCREQGWVVARAVIQASADRLSPRTIPERSCSVTASCTR